MKKTVVSIFILAVLLYSNFASAASCTPTKRYNRNGSIKFTFHITARQSKLLHTQFGYNIELANCMVFELMKGMGMSQSAVGNLAQAFANMAGVGYVAYHLWGMSINAGASDWSVVFFANPAETKRFREIAGTVGDQLLPFGQAGNLIIGITNNILYTYSQQR